MPLQEVYHNRRLQHDHACTSRQPTQRQAPTPGWLSHHQCVPPRAQRCLCAFGSSPKRVSNQSAFHRLACVLLVPFLAICRMHLNRLRMVMHHRKPKYVAMMRDRERRSLRKLGCSRHPCARAHEHGGVRHPQMNDNTLLLLLAAGALPTRNSRNASDGKPTACRDRGQSSTSEHRAGRPDTPVEALALPAHTHQVIKQLSYSRLRADKVYADVPHGPRCEQQ